jgi:hypothetical protein
VGGPKNSWNCLKKKYLKYLYKFETLIPFQVIPALLPTLETLSKIFNENAVKGCQRFSLNLCNVSRLPALQILLHPWEQKKVAISMVR